MSWEARYTKIQKRRLKTLVGMRLVARYAGRIESFGTIKEIVAEAHDRYVVHFENSQETCTLHGGLAHELVRKGLTSSSYTYDEDDRKVAVQLRIEEVMV